MPNFFLEISEIDLKKFSDIVNPLHIEVDEIYHLASPASPPHYMHNPVKTNTMGTINMLGKNKKNISSFIEKSQIIFN
jgi:UDP-glucuronate decarboxylase